MEALATFGGGCFWCVEAVFKELRGVLSVRSGYAGGTVPDPTYEQVCSGRSGHVEVVEIRFDPDVVGYEELVTIFFKTHDPTTKDRQGNDVGPQYRSVIYFHDDAQRRVAQEAIRILTEEAAFPAPIVTEVLPAPRFYPAEEYHQDYFRRNPAQPYCTFVIAPKVQKLRDALNLRKNR